ncbi:MAG: flagellar hook-associated protein FlgK [Clostridiales bacterium GWF2_36_10]|nr:MAG: flagellar hook-associated protein FlgK [Clostridiales bacterium GWF2_36_10]HAN20838.1 flagellar hook-associated protein FlgK [Clostridiales bacterium]
MRASFLGFEIAKTGLQAAETGLDVTGQNMAKMNTEGYSRQTIEQTSVYYNSTSYKYALVNSDRIGQGVSIGRITQVRDAFLDARYRSAKSADSELTKKLSILTNIENIYDETLTDGLGATLEDFYKSLQTLAANAGDIEYSGLARSNAQKITETLNYYNTQLETIKEQEKFDLTVSVNDINTLLNKIKTMNNTIQFESLQGNTTNELLDTRNLYFDDLASYVNITTEVNADGTVNVKAGTQYLIDATNATSFTLSLQESSGSLQVITQNGELEISSGSIKGYLDVLNGKGTYATSGENDTKGIKYYQSSLDNFATKFAELFNGLNGTGKPLFIGNTASTIGISQEWLSDANYITATTNTVVTDGDNDNILRMISTLDSKTNISDNFIGTFDEYVSMMMTDIAIDVNYVSDLNSTSGKVLSSVDNQREAVKGVSLNEETVNLLKYQKAFEASSRVITALDEMLDIIINRMGTVGR